MAEVLLASDERREGLTRVRPRYLAADRAGRGAVLPEMAQVPGVQRQGLTRRLAAARRARLRGGGPYGGGHRVGEPGL